MWQFVACRELDHVVQIAVHALEGGIGLGDFIKFFQIVLKADGGGHDLHLVGVEAGDLHVGQLTEGDEVDATVRLVEPAAGIFLIKEIGEAEGALPRLLSGIEHHHIDMRQVVVFPETGQKLLRFFQILRLPVQLDVFGYGAPPMHGSRVEISERHQPVRVGLVLQQKQGACPRFVATDDEFPREIR